MKNKITFLMQSRPIIEKTADGKWLSQVRWGRWETFKDYEDNAENFRTAVIHVTQRMLDRHIGSIVAIRVLVNGVPTQKVTKLYQAKWGHDNQPFMAYSGPVGEWWRERAGL
jgi:hypothetical protein